MPIIVKDYTWKQTTSNITIQLTLRGVSEHNVDIFTSSRYIKLNFEKYFFEALLLHSIDFDNSHCKISDTGVIFELKKNKDIIWDTLEPNISRSEKSELKRKFLEEEYLQIQEREKDKANRTAQLKKVAVQEQIELDTKQREHIDTIKNQEKVIALGNINQWSNEITPDHSKQKTVKHTKLKSIHYSYKPKETSQIIPMPRAVKTLEIDFTPREFPTPSRESKLDEENEWLRKQAEARRSVGFISEDIRPEERNPQFLKAKGDEFLKSKNYLGAISAYSYGIKIAPNFVDLYIARSEVHLLIGNFNKVIQDCSTAIDFLKPEISLNLKERALCVGRRGEALCKLGLTKQGVKEIEISLKLMPSDYFKSVIETVNDT